MSEKKKTPEGKLLTREIDTTSIEFLLSLTDQARRRILETMGQSSLVFVREMINPADSDELVVLKMFFLPEDAKLGLKKLLSHDSGKDALRRIYNNVKNPEVIRIASTVSSEDETAKTVIPERQNFDLAGNYAKSLTSLKLFDVLDDNGHIKKGDKPLPSFEQMTDKVTPGVLSRIGKMKEPRLLIIPDFSVSHKLFLINNRQKPGATDMRINLKASNLPSPHPNTEPITNWRAVIVESSREISTNPDELNLYISERLNQFGTKGVLDIDAYLTLLMFCVEAGKSIDSNARTFIAGESGELLFSSRYNNQIVIKKADLSLKSQFTHFRDFIDLGEF